MEKIIQNVGLFTKILKACDKVVTSFLGDFVVEKKIDEANTAHNFFSNQVYSKDMLEVIDSKIRQEQEEIDYIKKQFLVFNQIIFKKVDIQPRNFLQEVYNDQTFYR